MRTRFTDLVGCTVPLQLAAMPGAGTPELAAAVANAGGVGMIGLPMVPAPMAATVIDALRGATTGAVGVNFLMPFLDREVVEVAAARARVVEFFYGEPDAELVRTAGAGGALVSWQVGSRDEAKAAVDAGCALVVAQGSEAGGHVRGELGLLRLLAEVLDAVEVPVVAAGGIGTAREVAAVLAAGASAVRIGTRFLAAAESGAHPSYVESLLRARPEDAVLTDVFSLGWEAPHRVLRSSIDAVRALEAEVIGEVDWGGQKQPVQRLSPELPTRDTTGHVEAMALYAGQSVGAVREVEPARAIVAELMEGAEERLATIHFR